VSDREPAISPDGTRIVFVKRRANGNDDIYITSAFQDFSRPGGAPQQFLLVGDVSSTSPSRESRPAWTPDGTRIVFQSNRGTPSEGQAVKDFDIYMVPVPETVTTTTPRPTPIRLTNNIGDDIEPTVGPVVAEAAVARPNGQLAYASRRNDFTSDDRVVSVFVSRDLGTGQPLERPRTVRYQLTEDYDIYLQDLSLENTSSNRAQRIVNSPRDYEFVLGGTSGGGTDDQFFVNIDPNDPDNADDDYYVDIAAFGDDRRPTFTADGRAVVFCSDSNFSRPFPGNGGQGPTRDRRPDDDYDIVRVDIDSRNFTRLTDDTPTRTYQAQEGPSIDFGRVSFSEDFEPSAGAVPDITVTDPTALSGQTLEQAMIGTPSTQSSSNQSKNAAPIAVDDSFTTFRDTPVETPLTARDADGDKLSYTIRNKPNHGKLSGSGANRIYTPDAGFVGTDKFTFFVSDGKANSNVAEVTIKVVQSGGSSGINIFGAASASQIVVRPESNSVDVRFSTPQKTAPSATSYVVRVNNRIVEVLEGDYNEASNTLTLVLPEGELKKGDKVAVLSKP
jgi:hypothetical protein